MAFRRCERWITLGKQTDLAAASIDGRYAIYISPRHLKCLLSLCEEAGDRETGGILIGAYDETHRLATVTRVSGPPSDSRQTRDRFWRGTRGLQAILKDSWHSREYYLGEWHFHPVGAPCPSPTDVRQMRRISVSADYNCPEPVLVVIAGADAERRSFSAHVFPRGCDSVQLVPGGSPS